jgi:hypothetical protein
MTEKNVHGVLIVPNDTATFSELENQKGNSNVSPLTLSDF